MNAIWKSALTPRHYRLTALVFVNIKIWIVGLPNRDSAFGFERTCKLS